MNEREIIEAAHDYLREALRLEADAPRRFDYYAQLIEEMRSYALSAVQMERDAWRTEVEACLRAAGLTAGMAREVAAAIRSPVKEG